MATTDTTKVLIRLYDGDRERLQKYYPTIPYNKIIRGLLKIHLDELDKRLERRTKAKIPKIEGDL